jgi:hypothetical protein
VDVASVIEPAAVASDSELETVDVDVVGADPAVDDEASDSSSSAVDEVVDAEEAAADEVEEEGVVVLPELLPPSRGMQSSAVSGQHVEVSELIYRQIHSR